MVRPLGHAALIVLIALTGCGRHRRVDVARVEPEPPPTASPAVHGRDHGLEVWYWVIADKRPEPPKEEPKEPAPEPAPGGTPGETDPRTPKGPTLASPVVRPGEPVRPLPVRVVVKDLRTPLEDALRPYLDRPVPLSAELRERWRLCGLRALSIPVDELPKIEATVRMVGPVQRQWFGEVTGWTDLVHGPHFESGPVAGEDSVLNVDAGRMRLLGRCWSVPGTGPAPRGALRLELVPQHQPRQSEAQRLASTLEPPRRTEERGTLYPRLSLGVTIEARPGEGDGARQPDALVIVPEAPEVNWNAAPLPPWVESPVPTPAEFTVPTLGELMLSTPGTGGAPRTRAVIVLIPHPREKFAVLP